MTAVHLGFLTEATTVEWGAGMIAPLPDHDAVVSAVNADSRHYGGWFYPPLVPVMRDRVESKNRPDMPTGFGLPATHALTLLSGSGNAPSEDFFIALFGMLKGLRLQREGWQHFYRCPTRRGSLCDFYADDREIARTLDIATDFWTANPDNGIRKLAFGALHWHLFAQLYEHEFERFNAQYTALDACWKLAQKVRTSLPRRPTHAQRPGLLAGELGRAVLPWAAMPANESSCPLSARRNALVHEAMYADEPIGFAHPQIERGMELELTGFVARCLVSLCGVENEYTRSPVTTRQIIGFSFGGETSR